jgi:hypothetical protein
MDLLDSFWIYVLIHVWLVWFVWFTFRAPAGKTCYCSSTLGSPAVDHLYGYLHHATVHHFLPPRSTPWILGSLYCGCWLKNVGSTTYGKLAFCRCVRSLSGSLPFLQFYLYVLQTVHHGSHWFCVTTVPRHRRGLLVPGSNRLQQFYCSGSLLQLVRYYALVHQYETPFVLQFYWFSPLVHWVLLPLPRAILQLRGLVQITYHAACTAVRLEFSSGFAFWFVWFTAGMHWFCWFVTATCGCKHRFSSSGSVRLWAFATGYWFLLWFTTGSAAFRKNRLLPGTSTTYLVLRAVLGDALLDMFAAFACWFIPFRFWFIHHLPANGSTVYWFWFYLVLLVLVLTTPGSAPCVRTVLVRAVSSSGLLRSSWVLLVPPPCQFCLVRTWFPGYVVLYRLRSLRFTTTYGSTFAFCTVFCSFWITTGLN